MSILGALEREGQHALIHGLGKGPPPPQKTKARRPFLFVVDFDRVGDHIESFWYHRKLFSFRVKSADIVNVPLLSRDVHFFAEEQIFLCLYCNVF